MVRDAARHLDADSIHKASMCAMAKLHVTENCSEIVSQALQMFGGYGYLKDYPIQQYLRDLRKLPDGEGFSSEPLVKGATFVWVKGTVTTNFEQRHVQGSNAASLRTTARREVDTTKSMNPKFLNWSSYVVMGRHEGQPVAKSIFCFLIEDGMRGFLQAKKESKLGWNAQLTSIITFEDVKVPVSNQIGPDNYGFNIAMAGINGGRVNITGFSLRTVQKSLDLAIDRLKVRALL
ncbi:unnamed protein product [Haemonchus placei]|uniref:Acyl-CoA_dh_1 domain-containing protein n=1 Tax=Haemonchus placei TaxID=6290 RepID=A0A158QP45_HAEPC|nr:unnamed protein product [Haemonchus placei]